MKRVLLVGTGPCGYSVVNSLETLNNIWVMDGYTNFNDTPMSTRSHLALKQKFGSSHTYVDSATLGLNRDDSIQLPISYSRGGFGEIWGNGFTPYDVFELYPEADESTKNMLQNSMKELLDIIPFSHCKSELDSRFGSIDTWSNSKSFSSIEVHPFFTSFLTRRKKSKKDSLLFGQPNFLLDSKKCTKCGLCLTGCPYGALFDPGEHINRMFFSGELSTDRVIQGVLKKLEVVETGVRVIFDSDCEEKSEFFDEVILSTGPLSTALILMNSNLLPINFDLPDSQVFYGAFLSIRRFRSRKLLQEVGQVVCYPQDKNNGDFQVSLYTPSSTSRLRISQALFPKFLSFIKVPKILSDRIIPAIGFLPQSESGSINIRKMSDEVVISRVTNPDSIRASRKALQKVSRSLRGSGFFSYTLRNQGSRTGSRFPCGSFAPTWGKILRFKRIPDW